MELNADQILENAIRDGVREGIKSRLSAGYNNPIDKMVSDCLAAKGELFRSLLTDALERCIGDPVFGESIREAVRATLAKTLVQRFGGELEKQVNALKSDPATRARITVAIEDIVKSKV